MNLQEKKGTTITYTFQIVFNECGRKPNKIWVDKGSKFYNQSMKYFCKILIQRCIQHIIKENLLLLKDVLEAKKKIKFNNIK